MTEITDVEIFDPEAEAPEYERFIALNIQVPQTKGKRSYHRVTISGSLKDIGDDLSLILPSRVSHVLRSQHEKHNMVYKLSHHRMPSPNPKRDPYVVVCSCGAAECDHVNYALEHFQRILLFSQNSGRIAQQIAKDNELAVMAEQRLAELQDRLNSLRIERDTLARNLEMADRDTQLVSELQATLMSKEDEIELLSLEFHDKESEIRRYEQEIETAQENLTAVSMAWLRSGEKKQFDDQAMTNDVLTVVRDYFVPPVVELPPEEKFQDNVGSDHHRVANTHPLLLQLAQLEFVRELGISYRHQTKSGKIQVMPEVDTLEVLVPLNGEADIIRVLTTASTKPQQLLSAHIIAARFDLAVQT